MAGSTPRLAAKLALVPDDDGTVQIEITTSRKLESVRVGDEMFHPEGFLRAPSSLSLTTSANPGEAWRYIKVRAEVRTNGGSAKLVDRTLDMWEGSEERRLLARLADQETIVVVWVNEGVTDERALSRDERDAWRTALETTQGMTRERWREELADLAWRQSDAWRGRPRPRPYRQRTAPPPRDPVPFFAERSGAIPRSGRPELAGVTLPTGKRYPGRPAGYWGSDAPVKNLSELAGRLASAFSQTGVWPLAWDWEEDPDSYMPAGENLDAIDELDAAIVLRERWTALQQASAEPFSEFPGLAAASPPPNSPAHPFDQAVEGRLLLVPCNRPADAITQLGGLACEVAPAEISAVLRSWETRFAATLIAVAPSALTLSVAAPPSSLEHALALAAEHHALYPTANSGTTEWLNDMANVLTGHPRASLDTLNGLKTTRDRWDIAWQD